MKTGVNKNTVAVGTGLPKLYLVCVGKAVPAKSEQTYSSEKLISLPRHTKGETTSSEKRNDPLKEKSATRSDGGTQHAQRKERHAQREERDTIRKEASYKK